MTRKIAKPKMLQSRMKPIDVPAGLSSTNSKDASTAAVNDYAVFSEGVVSRRAS